MGKVINVYLLDAPIDFWGHATVPDDSDPMLPIIEELMPEKPRVEGMIFMTYMPVDGYSELQPVYLYKADNNGNTYLFSKATLAGYSEVI
jgi:hypothetical protein